MNQKRLGKELIQEIPEIEEKEVLGVLISPLSETPVEPDVVVIKGKPITGMWISKALLFNEDSLSRINYSVGGEQAACSEATIQPIKEKTLNISLGCFGCRSTESLKKEDLYVGVSINEIDKILSGLIGMKDRISDLA